MASEVLKLATFRGDAASVQALLTVAAGHTYTVLSVTICETGNAAEIFDLLIDDGGGGSDTYIYYNQALGAKETFEHTSKFVMEAADHLSILTASSSNIDVIVSYLDQTL
jgi:hypothetical protein|tara:strand:- start:25 stop:354 length:330 start_codon:yes stop_codon:yes gene_type:complete